MELDGIVELIAGLIGLVAEILGLAVDDRRTRGMRPGEKCAC
jgi:hypothetical protein